MSFLRAFAVSVFGTGASRVLGFVRDIVLIRWLGSSDGHDAFQQAFAIPGMFRRFVADEGLTGALIPAIARAESEEGLAGAQTLASQVFTALLMANAVLIALVMCFPRPFTYLVASGFTGEKFELTVQMTRWLMPFVGMVSLVSFCEGILNHRGHFLVPKLAPGIVSAVVIAAVVLGSGQFDEPAWALVAGFGLGGVVHVVVHLPLVWSRWGPVRVVKNLRSERARFVFRELGKVVAIGVFAQINILVLRTLTSWLPDGSAVQYAMSTRMIDLTQGIIAVAIGSALLPAIAAQIADKKWEDFSEQLHGALRLAAFLLFPASVGLFLYAVPVVAVVFLNDKFDWTDVMWTASTIQVLTPYMLSVAGVSILKRVFFALDKRNVVLLVGGTSVGLTAFTGWLLLDWGVVGLGVALSIPTCLQLVAYVGLLRSELAGRFAWRPLVLPLTKMASATVPMGIFAYWCVLQGRWPDGLTAANLQWFALGIAGAAVLYATACWLLGVQELTKVTGRLSARFGR